MLGQKSGVLVIGLLALVVLSGCAQVAVDAEVGGDGTVERYDVQIETSASNYERLASQADSEGYDSVQGYLLRDVESGAAESIDYDRSLSDDGSVTINVTLTDLDPAGVDGLTVVESDGELIYEDSTFTSDRRVSDDASLTYSLEMPGEITNSTADRVDGSTATWEREGAAALADTEIRAVAETPAFGVGPGPGPLVALLALVGTALAVVAWRSEPESE